MSDERDTPAVERVRADLGRLGDDTASAPEVPPPVTERVVSALRAAPSPQRRRRAVVRVSAAVGTAAALAATVLGTVVLTRSELSRHPPAQHLTSEPPPARIPLSDAEIIGLLTRPPDLGPLGDPRRLSSCVSGLGYPAATQVLGSRQVEIRGEPAVLLLLPGNSPDSIAALAVRPNCSSADTGLLADTQVRRP